MQPSPDVPAPAAAVLVLDTGSPRVSVALASSEGLLVERSLEQRQASGQVLGLVDQVLRVADLRLQDLRGIAALRGPGSFTGLRVGLATVLGLHQALGIAATAIPTLPIIGAWCFRATDLQSCVAAVDAQRGEWFWQRFRRRERSSWPAADTEIGRRVDLSSEADTVVAFGLQRLRPALPLRALEPPPLAGVAACLVAQEPPRWDPAALTAPMYLRPPAVSFPSGTSPDLARPQAPAADPETTA